MYMYISLQKDIPITQDRSLQMKTIVIPSAEEETPLKFLHRRGGIKSIEFFFFFWTSKNMCDFDNHIINKANNLIHFHRRHHHLSASAD